MTFKKTLMGTFIVLFFLLLNLEAQPRRTPSDKVREISQEDASERWETFKHSRQTDNFFFAFELKHSPRRAKESSYYGDMLAKRIGTSYLTRLRFSSPDEKLYDFLFILDETTGKAKAFSYNFETKQVQELKDEALLKPLADGIIYTPFDILMNYKYWNVEYQKAGRISQAVYFFRLSSPYEWVGDVEVALSREFNSPEQTQFFDKQGKLLRTFTLSSVKKLGDYWIVKTAEIKDEATKDKDKFTIQAANLESVLDTTLFEIQNLGKGIDRIELNRL